MSDGRGFEAQEESLGFALLESLEVTEEGIGVMKHCFSKITLAGVCKVKEKKERLKAERPRRRLPHVRMGAGLG